VIRDLGGGGLSGGPLPGRRGPEPDDLRVVRIGLLFQGRRLGVEVRGFLLQLVGAGVDRLRLVAGRGAARIQPVVRLVQESASAGRRTGRAGELLKVGRGLEELLEERAASSRRLRSEARKTGDPSRCAGWCQRWQGTDGVPGQNCPSRRMAIFG
jgi:hypothetical protein